MAQHLTEYVLGRSISAPAQQTDDLATVYTNSCPVAEINDNPELDKLKKINDWMNK